MAAAVGVGSERPRLGLRHGCIVKSPQVKVARSMLDLIA
jgi:hypothetical protein